ncbi:MAG: ATP-binding cassette domain-containing protein [Planctomycetes bacterium]|nr:ATP-binding cassette domain-containing protein [Planctomycetota bacterium]MCB9870051.1 ATP-binding cassette domain-containing protein [Planctomycetota bacterium]
MSEPRPFQLRLAKLEIGYGTHRIAGPLDRTLDSGAVHVLTGPNGSGKSTLLRTILGILPPLRGAVGGLDGRTASYVPQLATLDTGFPVTVEEVVGTGLRRRGPRRAARERIRAALAEVGMAQAQRRPFSRLSGGQAQRVLLARALCADAELVALDEPTAGLDDAAAASVWDLLSNLAARGRMVLVVTHDLQRCHAERHPVLVLDGGTLLERAG